MIKQAGNLFIAVMYEISGFYSLSFRGLCWATAAVLLSAAACLITDINEDLYDSALHCVVGFVLLVAIAKVVVVLTRSSRSPKPD